MTDMIKFPGGIVNESSAPGASTTDALNALYTGIGSATSANTSLYVDADAGSDTTGTGAIGLPYATIDHAISTLPANINHAITIYLKPRVAESYTIADSIDRLLGSKVLKSSLSLKAYVGSEWSTSFYTGTMSANSYFTHTDAAKSWTTNELRGKFLHDTVTDEYFPISGNTDTIIRCAGSNSYAAVNITTYAIVEPSISILSTSGYFINNLRAPTGSNCFIFFNNIKIDNLIIQARGAGFTNCAVTSTSNITMAYTPEEVYQNTGFTKSYFRTSFGSSFASIISAVRQSAIVSDGGIKSALCDNTAIEPYTAGVKAVPAINTYIGGLETKLYYLDCFAKDFKYFIVPGFFASSESIETPIVLADQFQFSNVDFFVKLVPGLKIQNDTAYPVSDTGVSSLNIGAITWDGVTASTKFIDIDQDVNVALLDPTVLKTTHATRVNVSNNLNLTNIAPPTPVDGDIWKETGHLYFRDNLTTTDLLGREAALTFNSGLTRSVNTVTNDLNTGKSGGQTIIGGTGNGENLTLNSTSGVTKGKIIRGTSAYSEVSNFEGIGTATPTERVHAVGTDAADTTYQHNSIMMDGGATIDKNFVLAEAGVPQWVDQIWRGEAGEFKYIFNPIADKDSHVYAITGEQGINKQSNVNNYHSYYINPGGGQDDAAYDGIYNKPFNTLYQVDITTGGATNPNVFRWRTSLDNGVTWGAYTTGVNCSLTPITLSNGVNITFGALTGHAVGDNWTAMAFSQLPRATLHLAPPMFQEINTTSNITLGSPVWSDITYAASTTQTPAATLLPLGTTSACYIGRNIKFNNAYFNIETAGVGVTLKVEFWNGSAWTQLTAGTHSLNEGTTNFTRSGRVDWDKASMTGWVPRYPEGVSEAGYSLYWIRFTSTTNVTTAPTSLAITPNGDRRFAIYPAHLDYVPSFYHDSMGRTIMGNTVAPAYSTMEVRGSEGRNTRIVTTNTTLNSTDNIVIGNQGGGITVTLPLASSCPGRVYTIMNQANQNMTLGRTGSDTINNATSVNMNTRYTSKTVISATLDGGTNYNWYVIGN